MGEKIAFTGKIWKNSNRYIILVPKKLIPLISRNKTYKITIEELK